MEFFCPYCRLWIDDGVHRQHHHNDPEDPDEVRDWRVREKPSPAADESKPPSRRP